MTSLLRRRETINATVDVQGGQTRTILAGLGYRMISTPDRSPVYSRNVLAIYLGLALLTCAVFGQTIRYPFVHYDDQKYVYENQRITAGLTAAGCVAAFTRFHAENWHPITTLSHMLDCQLWGLNPAGHHAANVLLHVIAAMLLFHLLKTMTGRMWRSAFVAAIFAIHPLRAESVAWISERKDVLSGVFFMLTIAAYLRYVRRPARSRYLIVTVVFLLGLMSKPSLVTLPLLLLLLDVWPLGRLRIESGQSPNGPARILTAAHSLIRVRCFVEKIPLFFLSLGCSVMTIWAQRQNVSYEQRLPFSGRLGNALASYVGYIKQMLWPTRLAVLYPNAGDRVSWVTVATSTLLLAGITIIAFRLRKTRPYLAVGWIWYLVALLPMIGIVQVGLQGSADRYTYLAQIGPYISIVWFAAELPILKAQIPKWILATAGAVAVTLLAWCAFIQTSSWKDTESLWLHALAVTKNNDVAHNNVATLLLQHGKLDQAIAHYQAALKISPGCETPNHLSPAIIENSLGNAFARKGDLDAAAAHYRKALQIRSAFPDAGSNLSAMLFRKGDLTGAISEYEKIVALPPEDSASHQKLAEMLIKARRPRQAIVHYRRALELAPESVETINSLAWILATTPDPDLRSGTEALALACHANELTHGNDPFVLRSLAAALAASGRPAEAAAMIERALELARNKQSLTNALEKDLRIYRGT